MTRTAPVRIPIDDFERGRLPRVCVLTGEPADGWSRERLVSRVGAQAWLLLVGLVPFLVVRAVTKKTAQGRLPVTEVAYRALDVQCRRRRRLAWGLDLAGATTCVLAVVVASRWTATAGIVLAVVGVALLVAGVVHDARTPVLRGHVEPSGRWVVVENAHPGFAAAVETSVRG